MKDAVENQTQAKDAAVSGTTGWRRSSVARWLLMAGVCLCATGVHAQDNGTAADGLDAPWTPDIVQAIDEYVPSPAFNGGRLSLDHFAAANSVDIVGGITAQLSNGDIVVAGLVPPSGVSTCNNGAALCSIGLVRYNAAGVRKTWSTPGSWGQFSNQYIVYPGTPQYEYIRAINVRPGFIDVMVDEINSSRAGLGRQDVRIVSFTQDGLYQSQFPFFGAAPEALDILDFYGAQMVQINSTRVIAVATAYDSVGPFVSVTRMKILTNGALDIDPMWGSPYGNLNYLKQYYPPNSSCAAAPCKATAGYAVRPVGSNFDDFYVAGSVQWNGDDWDTFVLKISSQDGSTKPEFSGDGWARFGFDQLNSNFNDRGAGLYVYQDEIYLAAQVAQKCHPGIGMAKINGANGNLIAAFGGSGRIVFGGQGNSPICLDNGRLDDVPLAISATGGRIGIVGYERSKFNIITSVTHYDPMLAVVDAVGGVVLDLDSHSVKRADGSRYGDAVLYSVYGGPSPQSPFTVAGNGRDATAGNTLSYVTGVFIPVSADRIFASGFE
ncbi:MAG: hypothetical protein WBP11_09760 [Dokdonella sp.]